MVKPAERDVWILFVLALAVLGCGSDGPSEPGEQTAAALAFVTQPEDAQVGALLAPAPRVAIQDALGHPVAGWTEPVTVRVAEDPGGALTVGTTAVDAVAGVATFSQLRIDRSGEGYTLVASSGGLTSVSSAFDIGPSPRNAEWSIEPAIATTCPLPPFPSVNLRIEGAATTVEASEIVFTVHYVASVGGQGDVELPIPFDYETERFEGSASFAFAASGLEVAGTLAIEGRFTGAGTFSATVLGTATLNARSCDDVNVNVVGTRVVGP